MRAARSTKPMRALLKSPRVSASAVRPRSRSNTVNALAWRLAVRNAPLLAETEDRRAETAPPRSLLNGASCAALQRKADVDRHRPHAGDAYLCVRGGSPGRL